ncbi:unnamed protein product [Rotaria sp. Silwood1]|nr:unnamed protein product [Rotaria sp. Silwood1]CAF4761472.1 unnamed protein product [Rotaria sp. Silwood1]
MSTQKFANKATLEFGHRIFGEQFRPVKEAIYRLRISEPEVWDERSFRISRAINFDIKRMFLPKDEWLQYENYVPYLQSYLTEIEREQNEE